MSDFLRVRNWGRFQYRTDKRMPWIRTYDEQLEDYEYTSLSDAQRGHLHDIRLLANRTRNKIPNDSGWVRAAIRASRAPDLHMLCVKGFLEPWVPDSELPASERYVDAQGAHGGRSEGVRDRDGDREKEHARTRAKANSPEASIRRLIANGAIADEVDLEAELRAQHVIGSLADDLRDALRERSAA